MNEKKYKKRLELQNKTITRQSKQIEELKLQVQKLELECKKKDETINSVAYLKEELDKNIADAKVYKEQYRTLIDELKEMKKIMNQELYKNRWSLVRFLIK